MRMDFLSRSRRWLGASALAITAGLAGGSAFLAVTSQQVTAQIQPAAQIQVPAFEQPRGFADLVEAVSPAVVSIVVEGEDMGREFRRGGGEFEFGFPDLPEGHPFRDFFENFGDQFGEGEGNEEQQQPQRRPRRMMAAGSGFVVTADGYVVTNNHVVENATKVTVVFGNGNELDAEIVGTDERTDLAVLKVQGNDLPFVKFADQDVRVGDWVVAVGNPFGLGGTVTVGVVSARGRDIGGSSYGDFLQIDAAVNTGNSGGPTFNTEGEVVGVNTAIFSPNGGSVGIAFAIPHTTVQSVVEQLRTEGSVTRGFLGVGIQDLNRDLAASLGLDSPRGALVTQPTEGGPAEAAGILSGDVIVAVDGDEISNALDLSRTIASKGPETTVEVTLFRDGEEQTVSVTLERLSETATAPTPQEEVPPAEPEAPAESSVGLTLVPNEGGEGLTVQEVNPDSVAAVKGFQSGDIVLEVNGRAVATAAEFEEAVRASERGTARIKFERNGNVIYEGLPLEAAE